MHPEELLSAAADTRDYLWQRTFRNIQDIEQTHRIDCTGIVKGNARTAHVSSNIEDVISDFIMVATPSSAHEGIAKLLAPYVTGESVIILNPGRTFGAAHFAETLRKCGITLYC